MITLGIDSTSPTASAALVEDGKLLAMQVVNSPVSHSVTLLPIIHGCLNALGLKVRDIGLMACAAGPGSFTGVRIGVSTLKGLAFPTDTPCIGVSALEMLSCNLVGFHGLAVPVMNARRNRVYTAFFRIRPGQMPVRLTADETLEIGALDERLAAYGETVYLCGDGMELTAGQLSRASVAETPLALRSANALQAAVIAESLWNAADEGQRSLWTPARLAPIYLNKPQAEREREERIAAERAAVKMEGD